MEALLKSGKKISGRLAQILVAKGRATPLDLVPESPEPQPAVKKRKTKKK